MSAKPRDITGQRFGRWTAIAITDKRHERRACWRVRCDCGNESVVCISYLTAGSSRSCGCLQAEIAAQTIGVVRLSHGQTDSPTYVSWCAMKNRCTNPNATGYENYGGRGIEVCERWLGDKGFENFLSDMGERPDEMTIERLDNDRGYEPGNCVWANRTVQVRNRRVSRLDESQVDEIRRRCAAGESPAAIARAFGVRPSLISQIKGRKCWNGTPFVVEVQV